MQWYKWTGEPKATTGGSPRKLINHRPTHKHIHAHLHLSVYTFTLLTHWAITFLQDIKLSLARQLTLSSRHFSLRIRGSCTAVSLLFYHCSPYSPPTLTIQPPLMHVMGGLNSRWVSLNLSVWDLGGLLCWCLRWQYPTRLSFLALFKLPLYSVWRCTSYLACRECCRDRLLLYKGY